MLKLNRRDILLKGLVIVTYFCIWAALRHFGISCIFRHFTGVDCPGCGIMRACLSLLHGDIKSAVSYHPMVFSLPVLIIYFFTDGHLFGRKVDFWLMIAILVGFFITWLIKLI